MHPRLRLTCLAILFLGGLFAFPGDRLEAQERPSLTHQRIVSVNPVALVFLGLISADYEEAVGDNLTWGSAVSYFDFRDRTYLSLDARLRYYLRDRALDGFAVGALVGFTRIQADLEEGEAGPDRGSAIGIGFTGEQQWLLGTDRRLAITLGGGAKRFFFIRDVAGSRSVQPVVRASVGWAF